MAEARRAVEPLPALSLDHFVDPMLHTTQLSATRDGFTLFIPHPYYIIRNAWRSTKRMYNKMHQAFMPLPVPVAVTIITGGIVWALSSPSTSMVRNGWLGQFLWNVDSKNPFSRNLPVWWRVTYLAAGAGTAIVLGFTFCHRLLLRSLLSYTGWMTEVRGKQSLKTKIWGVLLKYLYMRRGEHTVTQGYQTSLPSLPLPNLRDTCDRYMLSMEPLLSAEELGEVRGKMEAFLKGEGPMLQRYLWFKHLTAANYVSDWWLDVIYLRCRDSLMINSNYYGGEFYMAPPTSKQAARAAFMTYTMCRVWKETSVKEMLPPLVANGLVPMCMEQYTRAMGTTRVPGKEMDRLESYDFDESKHIVVMHKGRFFKVRMYYSNGRALSPLELEPIFQGILDDTTPASEGERMLGALTAWNRTKWAETRENFFLRHKTNRSSLAVIERAIITLSLDETAPEWSDLNTQSRYSMHGDGCNRWFDKSMHMIIHQNGILGMNGEHSWGDAPTSGHLFEVALARELKYKPYGSDGHVTWMSPEDKKMERNKRKSNTDSLRIASERLPFKISTALETIIKEAAVSAQAQIADLDLEVHHFSKFGKGAIKKAKCSPDGFIQMALQLAYYRNQGNFAQTYESASTRFYLNGRTETIRSCSNESCAFVRAMLGLDINANHNGDGAPQLIKKQYSTEEKVKLLRQATEKHSMTTRLAMTGCGVDRHLFALYVVSVGTSTESPFLQQAISRKWKLSTSQVPQVQAANEWRKGDTGDVYPRSSGGFGPVADDGYGVSYVLNGEGSAFFHVSSKRSCKETDSKKFSDEIHKTMMEMIELFNVLE